MMDKFCQPSKLKKFKTFTDQGSNTMLFAAFTCEQTKHQSFLYASVKSRTLLFRCITGLFWMGFGAFFDVFFTNAGSKVGARDWTTNSHRHRIHRPRKRPKIIEVVYQQLTQLGRTDTAVGKPFIYYCENSSSYSGRGAWSIYSMSMLTVQTLDQIPTH